MLAPILSSAVGVLLWYFLPGFALILLHNRFPTWKMGLIICALIFVLAMVLMTSPLEWVLFTIGGVAYGLIDMLFVYLKRWRYNTRSGYCIWVGVGWGFLTLVIYRLVELATPMFLMGFLLFTLAVLCIRLKNNIPQYGFEVLTTLLLTLTIFVFPKLFLISFCMGVITEFTAVEIFKTWKYQYPNYLQMGIGYAGLLVGSRVIYEIVLGSHSVVHFTLLGSLLGIIIFKSLMYAQKVKRLPKFSLSKGTSKMSRLPRSTARRLAKAFAFAR